MVLHYDVAQVPKNEYCEKDLLSQNRYYDRRFCYAKKLPAFKRVGTGNIKNAGGRKKQEGNCKIFRIKKETNYKVCYSLQQEKEKETVRIITKRDRPPKNTIVAEEDKPAALRYKITWKDYRIKQLEMEVELLRDFQKETGRS